MAAVRVLKGNGENEKVVVSYFAIPGGIGSVTFPVAAHSAPRANVVVKAGVCTCSTSWPSAVVKTRPFP